MSDLGNDRQRSSLGSHFIEADFRREPDGGISTTSLEAGALSAPDRYDRADKITVLIIVLAALLYLALRWGRLLTVGGGFDSTLLGNVLWRLANGFDSQTALTGGHYLATHASPILALFLPVFRFVPAVGMPMVYGALTASVALVGWAGYLVGRHQGLKISTRWWLLGAMFGSAASWLATQHQMNETTLGIGPLAMAMALSIRGDRLARVLPWAALAASCRIEMAAAVLVAGIVIWYYSRPRQGRSMIAISALFLGGYLTWLFLNPYETESVAAHFGHLGSTPRDIMDTLLGRPWALFEPVFIPELLAPLLLWLLPFGLIAPLMRPRWLLAAFPTAAIAILGVWPQADSPIEHYWTTFLAAGAIATPLAVSESTWLRSRLRALLFVGLIGGWAMLTPFFWFFFPSDGLTADDRAMARAVSDLGDGFVSVPGSLSPEFIDRPLLALFPRPFVCHEAEIGPYTAVDRPPELIVMPVDGPRVLDRDRFAQLATLLRSYELVAESGNYEAWQVVDVDRAAINYMPCSVETFSPTARTDAAAAVGHGPARRLILAQLRLSMT